VHGVDGGRHHHPAGLGQFLDATALHQQLEEPWPEYSWLAPPAERRETGCERRGHAGTRAAERPHHAEGGAVKKRRINQVRAARQIRRPATWNWQWRLPGRFIGRLCDGHEMWRVLSLAAQLAVQGSTPSRLRQDHDAFQFQLPRPGPAEPHGRPQPDIAQPDGGWPARSHRSRPRHRFPGHQIELHDRGQQWRPVHHVVEKEGVDLRIDLNHQSSALLIIASGCPLRAE